MTSFPTLPTAHLSSHVEDYPEGIVLPVDKPLRWTSADVIRKIKFAAIRHFGKRNLKVGHAGTLDPLAGGVLLVCIGAACRRAEALQSEDKEYVAHIRFGATTPSFDLEKEVDARFPFAHITEETVRKALSSMLGEQDQMPPLFSAKKVDGQRGYKVARRLTLAELQDGGEAASRLRPNRIVLHELELLRFTPPPAPLSLGETPKEQTGEPLPIPPGGGTGARIHCFDTAPLGLPEAQVRITCSKGTYIRALARDLGTALGSGAHLSALTRTRCGAYALSAALSVEEALALLK